MSVNQSDPPINRSGQSTANAIDYEAIAASPDFERLKRSHHNFVLPIAVGFMIWYFAFVLMGAFAPDLMATPVFGVVNLGVVLGLGQFVTTFGITMWYVSFANRRLDPLGAEIRAELEKTENR